MTILKRIQPASAFKIGVLVCAVFGLLAGIFCSAMALAAGPAARHAGMPFAVGAFAIVLCPIFWGLIGGISALLGAFIYNFTARWLGGLEIETS